MKTTSEFPIDKPTSFQLEIGESILTVPDTTKPVWHGTYHAGKLTIYLANVEGYVVPDSVTYIAVYYDHGGPDFMTYASYEVNMLPDAIVTHMQNTIFNAHVLAMKDYDPADVSTHEGTIKKPTLH